MNPPFLFSRLIMAVWLVCGLLVLIQQSVIAGEIVLQNDQFAIAFDQDSGALTRLEARSSSWIIERRPELGMAFRLNAPLMDHKDHFFSPSRNKPGVEIKQVSAQQLQLQWKNPTDEHGNILPVTLTADVTLVGNALTFAATLKNDSTQMVSTVDFPCLGNLNPPTPTTPLQAMHMWYGSLHSTEINPDFHADPSLLSKQSLFCLIQSPDKGLYIEMHDPTQPYLLSYVFEKHSTKKTSTTPGRLQFFTSHFAYVHPQTTVKLAPVVLRGYQGDWHAAADLYKEWRATWFREPYLPPWAREVHSWAMLRMNTTEDDYTIPYTNFVAYGAEYASNGVSAVQLVGWNKGGQDGGDPTQDTDPGLGTWQEFHDAIAQVQAKGVKVILFGKLNWADLTTSWYSNKLYQYECTDQIGRRYEQGGYAYVTPTQLAGIGLHHRAVMDFLDPDYRNLATEEFGKILALGSEGWLWDEVCHHATALYSWAPNHGYTPPGYVYGGDLPLSAQLRAAADKVSPDFIFSGEGPEDWLMQYFPVSETGVTAIPICQYLDRHCLLLAGVSGFDDREQLNLILLNRYVIQYEPYYYKGHLSDFPMTMAYGKKIDALRRKYKAYLWDGEFRDTLGANVSSNGPSRYAVFIAANGKRAVVIINPDFSKAITAKVNLPNAGQLVLATPEQPETVPTSGILEIPARSAAVVMEQ